MRLTDIKVIDVHSDIWMDIADKRGEGERKVFEGRHLDILKANQVSGLVYSLFTYEKVHYERQPERCLNMFISHFADLDESSETVYVENISEYKKAQNEGKFALFGMVEGLYGFGSNPDVIYLLKELGISVLGLVWSVDNAYATGCNTTTDKGLTPQGIEALKIAQKLRMIIDVSHMSEASFWDVEKNIDGTFMASHSNSFSLCPVPRNLKDNQIKAVAAHDGIIGLVTWPEFVDIEAPSLDKLIDHAVYIAELVGPRHLAFGFDFSYWSQTWNASPSHGVSKVTKDLEGITGVPTLLERLEKRGFSREEIDGMASKNFLRVFEKVCG